MLLNASGIHLCAAEPVGKEGYAPRCRQKVIREGRYILTVKSATHEVTFALDTPSPSETIRMWVRLCSCSPSPTNA